MPRQRSNAFVSRSGPPTLRRGPVIGHHRLIAKQFSANGFSDQGAKVLTDGLLVIAGLVAKMSNEPLPPLSLFDQRQSLLLQQGLRQRAPSAVGLAAAAAEAMAMGREVEHLIRMLDDLLETFQTELEVKQDMLIQTGQIAFQALDGGGKLPRRAGAA